uniref:Peptidase M13 C-terminal domain-containing protein n=1 Tax=Timema monikensis TaxID=170555 RepID=A0A7R9EE43_9NEOP|nr:unnamed protein product [Timema monikensis]
MQLTLAVRNFLPLMSGRHATLVVVRQVTLEVGTWVTLGVGVVATGDRASSSLSLLDCTRERMLMHAPTLTDRIGDILWHVAGGVPDTGILQAPFYDISHPHSLNYGGMGVVMGHELTHAFDDQGREYDEFGNLHQWWNNKTIDKFKNRTDCVVDQYSEFEINNKHLNGKQTLDEDVFDLNREKLIFTCAGVKPGSPTVEIFERVEETGSRIEQLTTISGNTSPLAVRTSLASVQELNTFTTELHSGQINDSEIIHRV